MCSFIRNYVYNSFGTPALLHTHIVNQTAFIVRVQPS